MKLKQIQQVCDIKTITALVDTLLTTYDTPKVYSEDPSVAIFYIAMSLGIEEIIAVPREELDGNHAIFENSKLKIDKDDKNEKQVFSYTDLHPQRKIAPEKRAAPAGPPCQALSTQRKKPPGKQS